MFRLLQKASPVLKWGIWSPPPDILMSSVMCFFLFFMLVAAPEPLHWTSDVVCVLLTGPRCSHKSPCLLNPYSSLNTCSFLSFFRFQTSCLGVVRILSVCAAVRHEFFKNRIVKVPSLSLCKIGFYLLLLFDFFNPGTCRDKGQGNLNMRFGVTFLFLFTTHYLDLLTWGQCWTTCLSSTSLCSCWCGTSLQLCNKAGNLLEPEPWHCVMPSADMQQVFMQGCLKEYATDILLLNQTTAQEWVACVYCGKAQLVSVGKMLPGVP